MAQKQVTEKNFSSKISPSTGAIAPALIETYKAKPVKKIYPKEKPAKIYPTTPVTLQQKVSLPFRGNYVAPFSPEEQKRNREAALAVQKQKAKEKLEMEKKTKESAEGEAKQAQLQQMRNIFKSKLNEKQNEIANKPPPSDYIIESNKRFEKEKALTKKLQDEIEDHYKETEEAAQKEFEKAMSIPKTADLESFLAQDENMPIKDPSQLSQEEQHKLLVQYVDQSEREKASERIFNQNISNLTAKVPVPSVAPIIPKKSKKRFLSKEATIQPPSEPPAQIPPVIKPPIIKVVEEIIEQKRNRESVPPPPEPRETVPWTDFLEEGEDEATEIVADMIERDKKEQSDEKNNRKEPPLKRQKKNPEYLSSIECPYYAIFQPFENLQVQQPVLARDSYKVNWKTHVVEDEIFVKATFGQDNNYLGWVKIFIAMKFGLLSASYFANALLHHPFSSAAEIWNIDKSVFSNIMSPNSFSNFSHYMEIYKDLSALQPIQF